MRSDGRVSLQARDGLRPRDEVQPRGGVQGRGGVRNAADPAAGGGGSSVRRLIVGPIAMAFAAVLVISGSVPAYGVVGDKPIAPVQASAAPGSAQTLNVGSTTALTLERDAYTSAPPPPPPPPPPPAPAPVAKASTAGGANEVSVGWSLPVSGRLSSPYGSRPNAPVAGVNGFHSGTDIASTCGEPVRAAQSGTVVEAGTQGTYGKWILIDHGNGIKTGYAHSSEILVDRGDSVATGSIIARVGSTGASTGCHVHFETRVNEARVNPVAFMSSWGVNLG